MALILDNGIFFEFVPFVDRNMDEEGRVRQDATVLSLEQAAENTDYVLLISTVSGAWRYMIGDTVMLTDKERSEIKITGRTTLSERGGRAVIRASDESGHAENAATV